ncbi:hypothetical protein EMCRGX_G013388 [Ephydatia muelleri]
MDGAWMDGALMDGAWMDGALMDGALMDGALMDGALMDGALMDGAWLDGLGTDVLAGVVYMSETDGPEEVLADGKLLGHWEKCRPVDGSAPGFRPAHCAGIAGRCAVSGALQVAVLSP